MKNLFSIVAIVATVSVLFVGCGFIDGNSDYIESEEPASIELSYDKYAPARLDTMGYED